MALWTRNEEKLILIGQLITSLSRAWILELLSLHGAFRKKNQKDPLYTNFVLHALLVPCEDARRGIKELKHYFSFHKDI